MELLWVGGMQSHFRVKQGYGRLKLSFMVGGWGGWVGGGVQSHFRVKPNLVEVELGL